MRWFATTTTPPGSRRARKASRLLDSLLDMGGGFAMRPSSGPGRPTSGGPTLTKPGHSFMNPGGGGRGSSWTRLW